jgi:hypothetical protein
MPMRRKLGQPTFPTLYFKDDVLSIPGYTLEKVDLLQTTTRRNTHIFSGGAMARHREYDDVG